jgi:membrane-associated phospholipid phosphatase
MEDINKVLYGIIGLWTFLAILFGFFDLEISKIAVIYKDSLWSELGSKYGNKFDNSLFYLALTILLGSIFNDIKLQRKAGLLMIVYASLSLEYSLLKGNSDGKIFSAGVTIIFILVFLLLTYNKNWREFVPMAISFILLVIILDLTVNTMKIMWGRVRFNSLSSDAQFTEWYIINGNGTDSDNQSFPSGHTSAAWCFLPLLFLMNNRKMDKKTKILLIVSVLGFGLFIGISRVLKGAHYASDVLFSTGMASLMTIYLYKTFSHIESKYHFTI